MKYYKVYVQKGSFKKEASVLFENKRDASYAAQEVKHRLKYMRVKGFKVKIKIVRK